MHILVVVLSRSIKLPWALSRSSSTQRGLSVQKQALKVDDVLVTERSELDCVAVAAEEAMALALAAAKAARDAVSYADAMVVDEEFPTEFDLLRLERARLSDMEHSFRMEYDAEAAMLEAELSYVQKLESLLGGVSSLIREADVVEPNLGTLTKKSRTSS